MATATAAAGAGAASLVLPLPVGRLPIPASGACAGRHSRSKPLRVAELFHPRATPGVVVPFGGRFPRRNWGGSKPASNGFGVWAAFGPDSGAYATYSADGAPKNRFPTIKPVTSDALSVVLPLTGTGEQVLRELGGPTTWIRRSVLSFFGSMLLYNWNTFLTIIAAFYWAWCPMFSAARVNAVLRVQYPYAGIWSGRIINSFIFEEDQTFIELVIGDESGFTIEMRAPLRTEREKVIALGNIFNSGESVRMLALSDKPSFSRFIILREAYFPKYSFWLGDQTYLERSVFEEMVTELDLLEKHEQDLDEVNMICEILEESEPYEYSRYYKNREPQNYAHNNWDSQSADFSTSDSQFGCYSDSSFENVNPYNRAADFY